MVADSLRENAPSRNESFARTTLRMMQPTSMKTPTYQYGVEEVDGNDAWALMTACAEGDMERVKALVAKDPRLVNAQYWYQLPVHLAAREGHAEIVKFLLNAGADPGQSRFTYSSWQHLLNVAKEREYDDVLAVLETTLTERYNYSRDFERLKQAIMNRSRQEVDTVLAEQPELARASDALGNTAIHWAVLTRQLPLIDLFIELGADINAKRADGRTATAVSHGDYWYRRGRLPETAIQNVWAVLGYLLGKGAEYSISIAVSIGDGEAVQAFLSRDPTLANRLDSARSSLLALAAQQGHTAIVRLLLEYGADPNAPEDLAPKGRALFEACAGSRLELVKLLLEHGADPNAGTDSSGCCLTIVEVTHPDKAQAIQELLIEHGAFKPPYALSPDELKAAILADDRRVLDHEEFMRCVLEDDEVARVLLETHPEFAVRLCDEILWSSSHPRERATIEMAVARGFDVNQADWQGTTLLHVCAKTGDIEAARAFLDFGADVNAVEPGNGGTPLAWAAQAGQREMVKFLLERGADPNLARGKWAKPLVWASKAGHAEIADLLRGHGATE